MFARENTVSRDLARADRQNATLARYFARHFWRQSRTLRGRGGRITRTRYDRVETRSARYRLRSATIDYAARVDATGKSNMAEEANS